jgi:hypothetical protein
MGAPAAAPRRMPVRPTAPPRRPPRRRKKRARPNRALASAAPARRRSRSRPMPAGARMIQPAVAGAAMLPQAGARAVGTVRDISDSGLIVGLTRGRGWIGLLCALLGGIVALNVVSLSLNAGAGRVSQQVDELETQNSALRAQIDERLSAGRVEAQATALGLAVPRPRDITYLDAHDGDAAKLANLLRTDTLMQATSIPSSYPSSSGSSTSSTASAPSSSAPTTTVAPSAPAPSSGSSGGGSSGGGSTATTGGVGL